MSELEHPAPSPRPGVGRVALLTLAGVTAAAWLWNRRGEEALASRTARRLRPFAGRSGA